MDLCLWQNMMSWNLEEQETLTRTNKKNNLAAVMEMGAQFLHIMYIVSKKKSKKIKPVLFGGKWLQFIYFFFFFFRIRDAECDCLKLKKKKKRLCPLISIMFVTSKRFFFVFISAPTMTKDRRRKWFNEFNESKMYMRKIGGYNKV